MQADQSAQTNLWEERDPLSTPVLMPKEELKFASTASDLPLLKQALLKTTDNGRTPHTTLTSTYYDTASASLRRAGLALRVQEQNRRYIQTVIAANVSGVPRLGCGECEDVIDSGRPDPRALNCSAHLPETLGEAELLAQFTAVLRRTLFVLEPDESTQIEGALDEGELRTAASDRTEPICEVGLQLKRGDPAALYATGLRLLQIAPLRIEIRSKAERGFDLLGGTIDKPQVEHTPPFDLKPDMTVEEGLQRIGRGCLTMLLRNEAAALADVPEGVHQIRVGVRRLRSAVAAVKRMLPPEQFAWVSRDLKWVADVLGPARNWDVFSGSLLAPVRSALRTHQDLEGLSRVTEQKRQAAHEGANAAIRSPRYTAALLNLSQWFASRSWRNQPVAEPSALLMAPIGAVAPGLIARRYKKAKKAIRGLDELTPQQRHEVRIAVKKLRYTIEFLEDLFDTDKVAKFVGRLKPLQDDLGYENDVRVANELLADLPNSDDAAAIARAAGVALGWHDRGLADHDRKLRKHVRRFRQERPFW